MGVLQVLQVWKPRQASVLQPSLLRALLALAVPAVSEAAVTGLEVCWLACLMISMTWYLGALVAQEQEHYWPYLVEMTVEARALRLKDALKDPLVGRKTFLPDQAVP